MAEQQQRAPSLDALRVLAMLAVMVIHLSATGYAATVPGSYEWTVCLSYNSAARFAVPVFAMISGAIFLDPQRQVTSGTMLRRVLRLMGIFIGWSLVYALAEPVKMQELPAVDFWKNFPKKILAGYYHMWYLYLIMGLYLLTPAIRLLSVDRKRSFLLIIPAFLVGLAPFGKYVTYLGYFCLGAVLHRSAVSPKGARRLLLFAVVSYGTALLLGIGLQKPQWLLQEQMPHVWLCSAAVFVYLKTVPIRCRRLIEGIAPCQMGIYLLHPAVNFLLRWAGLDVLTFDPLLCIPICTLLVALISYAVVRLMKRIPVIRFFA